MEDRADQPAARACQCQHGAEHQAAVRERPQPDQRGQPQPGPESVVKAMIETAGCIAVQPIRARA